MHECKSGFRYKHSCNTALVKLIDQWIAKIDKGDMIGTLFIDFRKAVDLVGHSLLIKKLVHYKLNRISLKWSQSYRSSRFQNIKSENGLSDFPPVLSGVPQGSIFGPTLFLSFSILSYSNIYRLSNLIKTWKLFYTPSFRLSVPRVSFSHSSKLHHVYFFT